jgi:hypothetical protein
MFHFRNIARKLIKPPGFAKVNSPSRANYGMGTAYAECENYDESGCGGRCGQQVSSNGVFCPKAEFSSQVFLRNLFFQRTGNRGLRCDDATAILFLFAVFEPLFVGPLKCFFIA